MPAAHTAHGAATRARIVAAAADLISRNGVARTSLDDVRAVTATSKSQLYHYFTDKSDLVRAVIDHHRDTVLAEQRLAEEPLSSLAALHRWRYRTIATHRRHGFTRPCPLGRLACELPQDDDARAALEAALGAWHRLLAVGLHRMVVEGTLSPRADPALLATALLSAVQGGLVLACTARDVRPLRAALDVAVECVQAHATPGAPAGAQPEAGTGVARPGGERRRW